MRAPSVYDEFHTSPSVRRIAKKGSLGDPLTPGETRELCTAVLRFIDQRGSQPGLAITHPPGPLARLMSR